MQPLSRSWTIKERVRDGGAAIRVAGRHLPRLLRQIEQAGKENPAATKHSSEPTAGNDQNSENQSVAVDDPLHGSDIGAEIPFHGRQGYAECGEVVSDDENGEAHGNKAGNGRAAERIFGFSHSTLPRFYNKVTERSKLVIAKNKREMERVRTGDESKRTAGLVPTIGNNL
jgi:hypothetical protein